MPFIFLYFNYYRKIYFFSRSFGKNPIDTSGTIKKKMPMIFIIKPREIVINSSSCTFTQIISDQFIDQRDQFTVYKLRSNQSFH